MLQVGIIVWAKILPVEYKFHAFNILMIHTPEAILLIILQVCHSNVIYSKIAIIVWEKIHAEESILNFRKLI